MRWDDGCTMSQQLKRLANDYHYNKSIADSFAKFADVHLQEFRQYVICELKERKATVAELATAAGIKKDQLKRFLYSNRNLCGCTLHQLAEAMDKTPNKNCPFQ